MNKIIESFLNTHIMEYSLNSLPTSVAFEHFINKAIINKYVLERFEPADIMTEDGEKGLDGVAILLNDKLITSTDELSDLVSKSTKLEVRFVFIQSKMSESFSGSDIGDFTYGVKVFFEDSNKRPVTNERMENLIQIKDEIYKHSVNFAHAPKLDLYYVCCGKWNPGNGLQTRIDSDIEPLKNSSDFSDIEFLKYDSDKIITTYKEMKKKIDRNFIMEKKVTFPSIEGVMQAYIGFVKCKDFIKILQDSDGKMLTNIFEDNVRDFQGYNLINKEIKNTIHDDTDQDRFAILNNGITIVAKNIKVTGDNIEFFDYQVVNGCQTSYVLFDNRNIIKENTCIVVKIIEVKDEVISDRIIFTTNRQTEIKSEAFTATKIFHKNLQDFYNSIEPQYRLHYERRSKQFDLSDTITKDKVVTLTTQINSYISMFLNEPHSTHRYYGELLEAYKNKIFLQTDAHEVYYISSYFNYYLESQFKKGTLSKKYKKFKNHIICAMRGILVGSQINFGKAKQQKKEFKIIFEAIQNSKDMDKNLRTATTCLDKVLASSEVLEKEYHRNREITNRLLSEIGKFSVAKKNDTFIKKNDLVHCIVTGVGEAFVYVDIKTEDARSTGTIHISNVNGKYISNLKNEVEIGTIFQAKIISDDYFASRRGWGLTKVF